jgi:VIT1/CCC1 family predicted Fe2+/Mn2+ transporter
METVLWIVQAVLAAVFLTTGLIKLTQPRQRLAEGEGGMKSMSWAAHVTDPQFRAIGLVEVLGAIGLILPAALGIAPILTPIAATGLALAMVGAVLTHLRLGEKDRIAAPLVLLVLLVFVAIERFGPHSL